MTRTFFACVLLLSTLAGCVSDAPKKSAVKSDASPWLDPSPNLRQQIEDRIERLPWTHGVERVELIQWFATVGEPAYARLLEVAVDDRPDVAGSALAALGATGDSRLVEPIRNLRWSYALPEPVQLERARALVRLGDWREMPLLIDGLESELLYVRALCSRALQDATREKHDYDPRGPDEERQAAVARWRHWWELRQLDPLLARGPRGSAGR